MERKNIYILYAAKHFKGKSYQECRVKKRERRQPGTINSEEYMIWDKTGQAPGGLYGVTIFKDNNRYF